MDGPFVAANENGDLALRRLARLEKLGLLFANAGPRRMPLTDYVPEIKWMVDNNHESAVGMENLILQAMDRCMTESPVNIISNVAMTQNLATNAECNDVTYMQLRIVASISQASLDGVGVDAFVVDLTPNQRLSKMLWRGVDDGDYVLAPASDWGHFDVIDSFCDETGDASRPSCGVTDCTMQPLLFRSLRQEGSVVHLVTFTNRDRYDREQETALSYLENLDKKMATNPKLCDVFRLQIRMLCSNKTHVHGCYDTALVLLDDSLPIVCQCVNRVACGVTFASSVQSSLGGNAGEILASEYVQVLLRRPLTMGKSLSYIPPSLAVILIIDELFIRPNQFFAGYSPVTVEDVCPAQAIFMVGSTGRNSRETGICCSCLMGEPVSLDGMSIVPGYLENVFLQARCCSCNQEGVKHWACGEAYVVDEDGNAGSVIGCGGVFESTGCLEKMPARVEVGVARVFLVNAAAGAAVELQHLSAYHGTGQSQ